MNPIAIMQGRLSAPRDRMQSFPWGEWEREFEHAQALGMDGIEWLFEYDRWEENPILSSAGRGSTRTLIAQTGVSVSSVCATYFMAKPLFQLDEEARRQSINILSELIVRTAEIGARTVLIPLLEVSRLHTAADRDLLLNSLKDPLEIAAQYAVMLGIEAELPTSQYLALVTLKPHKNLGIYYDVGNATAAGYNTAHDLSAFGRHLVGVHLKDRRLNGPNVPFGEGDTDFVAVGAALKRINYSGPLVLESASGVHYLDAASRNRKYILDMLDKT
jgi:L-ribulose-5-phosphate 3-epimerase